MGNKKELTADELAEKKDAKGLFPQLFFKDGSYKLEVVGTEKVGGNDAYKVKVTGPSGTVVTQYYDAATGNLVKEESVVKTQGQEVQRSAEYSNFKKVGNVLFPFTTALSIQSAAGNQDITMAVKDIKVNEGVTAEDFK